MSAKAAKRVLDLDEKNQDVNRTPPKKRKTLQRYKDSYRDLWPCLTASKRGECMVHCTVCKSDFSCSHAGKNDCKRHVESKVHKNLNTMKQTNMSMKSFVGKTSMEIDHQRAVTRAEVLMCELIAEMNLPITTADTFNKAFKIMFPDSNIAQGMKCARNKATAIVLDLARMTQKSLSERLKSAPFSNSTDGSNDATSKQYPLVVRTKNTETGLVNSELLSIPVCSEAATGQNIFNLMDKDLTDRNITWENCLSMGSDNASVMTGHRKGVYAYVKEKQPTVYLSGCVLHLIHISAKKAADALPSIDDVLIDIYYYFNKSDSRKLSFKGCQDLYDLEQKRMLKHVCTRWLSIGRCIERLLFNWDALKDYFYKEFSLIEKKKAVKDAKVVKDTKAEQKSESSKGENDKYEPSYAEKKVDSIFSFIKSPTNKLFTLFLSYTINVYDEVLKNLQAEDPRIHKLRGALHSVMRKILSRFVKPSAMVGKSVDEVQFKLSYNQKVDNDLVIGNAAKEYIKNKEKKPLKRLPYKGIL